MESPPVSVDAPARRLRVILAFCAVTLIWGTTWIVIKDQLGLVPASWSVTYRFTLAGLVMLAVAAWNRDPLWLGWRRLPFVAAFGIAQFCFNFNFVYRAEHYVTSGLVALVFALLFVPNALFSRLWFGHQVSRRFIIGSLIGIAGIALLFVQEIKGADLVGNGVWMGVMFTLAGVLSASSANVMQASPTARALPMASMLASGMLIGSIINAIYAWSTVGPPVWDARPSYGLGLAYLGVMASALAFSLYFWTIRQLGAARAAYSSVLIPIIAMGISTLVENYHWTALGAAGGLLAMAGMVIALGGSRSA